MISLAAAISFLTVAGASSGIVAVPSLLIFAREPELVAAGDVTMVGVTAAAAAPDRPLAEAEGAAIANDETTATPAMRRARRMGDGDIPPQDRAGCWPEPRGTLSVPENDFRYIRTVFGTFV